MADNEGKTSTEASTSSTTNNTSSISSTASAPASNETELKVIDYAMALSQSSDDEDFLMELLGDILAEENEKIEKMEKAITDNDHVVRYSCCCIGWMFLKWLELNGRIEWKLIEIEEIVMLWHAGDELEALHVSTSPSVMYFFFLFVWLMWFSLHSPFFFLWSQQAYLETAHGVKGVALNLGIKALAESCKLAEFLGKSLRDARKTDVPKIDYLGTIFPVADLDQRRQPLVDNIKREYKRLREFVEIKKKERGQWVRRREVRKEGWLRNEF